MTAQTPSLMTAIGTMSGTSMDGVDVALVRTDGETVERGPSGFRAYTAAERQLLRDALADAAALTDRTARSGILAQAEQVVTAVHADAIQAFMTTERIDRGSIDVVGFHGQTVLHRPDQRLTVQLGDGPALARMLGLPVVYDLRADDVASGGQGAPLVPAYHHALVRSAGDLPRPVDVVNIGGVSNITFVGRDEHPIACDTGPGNALIDDVVLMRTGRPYDEGGALARRGRVDEVRVARWLTLPFFRARPPKSLDRNDFIGCDVSDLTLEDAVATLTAFTARAIALVQPLLPEAPRHWIVCGGGARNTTMLSMLADAVKAPVTTADQHGWSADAMEAEAFGFLAVRSLRGLPLTFPGTTGVPRPLGGGRLVRLQSSSSSSERQERGAR